MKDEPIFRFLEAVLCHPCNPKTTPCPQRPIDRALPSWITIYVSRLQRKPQLRRHYPKNTHQNNPTSWGERAISVFLIYSPAGGGCLMLHSEPGLHQPGIGFCYPLDYVSLRSVFCSAFSFQSYLWIMS